jgi:aspartate/methionine/tyrosine aminotransferase
MPAPPALPDASLGREAPALLAALSPLGLRLAPAAPPELEAPSLGLPELRRRWREWQRRDAPVATPSTLPVVTAGLSHALSLVADLFGGSGRAVAVAAPFWGNYRQAFATRTGAEIRTAPAYLARRYNAEVMAQALDGLPDGAPAVAILNFPSNPGGYSPTPEERRATIGALLESAERRPLVVVCDDAYAGLVFEPGIPRRSLFWDLAGLHPRLTPVKIDGATKELSFFGGRVGFLTFALAPESAAARVLEAKLGRLIASSAGGAPGESQKLVLQTLCTPGIEAQVEAVRGLVAERYRALRPALARVDPELLTVLPFNSGCFALVEIPEALGVDSETVRRHCLERHEVGLVSIAPRYLRIAHCSVDAASLPALVEQLERGVAELAGRPVLS